MCVIRDPLFDDFHSHLRLRDNVHAHHYVAKGALANGPIEFVMGTGGLLVNKDVCKVT